MTSPLPNKIRLVIGLGNPGAEYENTYHNVGFLALDALFANAHDAPAWKTHKKIFSYVRAGTATFIKPLTFMNESGIAAKEALKKFRAAPEEMLVVHDESDLPVGDFKISVGKNSAGHRGVQSVIDHVGTNGFERARIGIRPAGETKRKKASTFVLRQITKKDRAALGEVFEKVEEGLRIKD
jgi:PTH1 family peptidyl-tRNA hydrolase